MIMMALVWKTCCMLSTHFVGGDDLGHTDEKAEGLPIHLFSSTAYFDEGALLSENEQTGAHTEDLICFVRREAKDRGMSHTANGHLCPNARTVRASYIMQVLTHEIGKPHYRLQSVQPATAPPSIAQDF